MLRPLVWTRSSGRMAAGGRLFRDGVAAPAIAAIDGQSVGFGRLPLKPDGNGVRPLSMIMCPSEWPLLGWVKERTSAQSGLHWARRGRCSQIWMPGVLVAIGLNSPRIDCGALGFKSKLSSCD